MSPSGGLTPRGNIISGVKGVDRHCDTPIERPSSSQLAALLQLASPALPIGAFSYSQGLEAAVNAKVVVDETTAGAWIRSQFEQSFLPRELYSLQAAFKEIERIVSDLQSITKTIKINIEPSDLSELGRVDQNFVASRDSSEARLETRQLGASLCRWLQSVAPGHLVGQLFSTLRERQEGNIASATAFAGVGFSQGLSMQMTRFAWAFSWLENQVQAAVKLVPLGQSSGQRLLLALRPLSGLEPPLEAWTCTPMASLLMMRHERQYSRLFRS